MIKEKIVNKRKIVWTFAWRLFLMASALLLSINLFTNFISTILFKNPSPNVSYIIITFQQAIPFTLIHGFLTILSAFFIWPLSFKWANRKVTIHKQNERFVLKSLTILTIILSLLFCGLSLKETINNLYNIPGINDNLKSQLEWAQETENMFIEIELYYSDYTENPDWDKNKELFYESIQDIYLFDFEKFYDLVTIYIVISSCYIIILLFITFLKARSYLKNTKKSVVDDLYDENGNIIKTQNDLSKKTMKFINISILIIILVFIIFIGNICFQKIKEWQWEKERENKSFLSSSEYLANDFTITENDISKVQQTIDIFNNIELNSTLDEFEQLYGDFGELSMLDPYAKTFTTLEKGDTTLSSIVIRFDSNKTKKILSVSLDISEDLMLKVSTPTNKNLNVLSQKIKKNMSYNKIVKLLGSPHFLHNKTTLEDRLITYSWTDENGNILKIRFKNNKAAYMQLYSL